jgi:hypothetical protein
LNQEGYWVKSLIPLRNSSVSHTISREPVFANPQSDGSKTLVLGVAISCSKPETRKNGVYLDRRFRNETLIITTTND